MVIEGFQLLSKWTARIWEQCAWKFSRPYKDAVPSEMNETSASYSDYEKVLYSILCGICYWDAVLRWSRISYDYYNHMLACIECGKLKSFLARLCSLERLYLQVYTQEKFL